MTDARFRADKPASFDGTRFTLAGAVEFAYRDLVLTCDELTVNLESQLLNATGHVRITQGERVFTGDRLHYDLKAQTGNVDNAHVKMDGFDFTGEVITVSSPLIRIKNSAVTACRSPDRHFELRGEAIEIRPGESVTFLRTYIVLAGRRLVRVPKYTVKLKRKDPLYQGQGITPVAFVNGRDGVYLGARYLYPLTRGADSLSMATTFGYSVVRGFRGGPELGYQHPDFSLELRAKYHDTADYHFNPDLLVDARPEFIVRSRAAILLPGRLGAYVNGSVGSFKELPTSLSGHRRTIEFHLDTRPATLRYGLFAHAFYRHGSYSGDNQLDVLGAEVGVRGRASAELEGLVSVALQEVGGRSFFSFDEVLIAKELQSSFDWRFSKDFIIPMLVRYDIERDAVRDVRFGLMRSYDCLAYGLSFSTARREFRFEGRFLLGKSPYR